MTTATLDVLRDRLSAAAAGMLYVTESEAPFTPVAFVVPGAARLATDDVRRHLGVPASTPIVERSLDEFFRPLVDDVDPADAAAQGAVPRARALRELIRTLAPSARAFRVGDGPEVRYLVAGPTTTPGGAMIGVVTTGYES